MSEPTSEMIEAGNIAAKGFLANSELAAIYLAMRALDPERKALMERGALLNDIAVVMSEFVDNWPNPKRVSTALALIAKTFRIALDPPKHDFWGAGEPDCPREIKAGNGELHTLRCKVCGEDNPRDDRCLPRTALRNISGGDDARSS